MTVETVLLRVTSFRSFNYYGRMNILKVLMPNIWIVFVFIFENSKL